MIETVKLTQTQLAILKDGATEWFEATLEQQELVATCGPDQRCAVIGNEFVRMSADQLEAILKSAFESACYAGISELDITRDGELKGFEKKPYATGDQCLYVTTTATDGRSVTCAGPIVLPTNMH